MAEVTLTEVVIQWINMVEHLMEACMVEDMAVVVGVASKNLARKNGVVSQQSWGNLSRDLVSEKRGEREEKEKSALCFCFCG